VSDGIPVVTPIGIGAATARGGAAAVAANGATAPATPTEVADGSHESTGSTGLGISEPSIYDTLAPGAHLGFGDEPKTLAVEGPRSEEFFIDAAVPVARTSTRVPLESPLAPEVAPEKETRGARRRRLGIPRRVTFRVIVFVLLIAAVPVAAYFVLRWYAYDNWTVTLQGSQVVIKQGQPGGVLWFHPRLAERTPYTIADIPVTTVPLVKAGVQEPSLARARQYVSGLRAQSIGSSTASTTTSTSTTTTTTGGAAVSTTTAPPAPPGAAP
jgi:hypothetical protein